MNSSKKPIKSKTFKLRDFDFKFEAGVVFVVYLVWFTYIFGILGHVCPAAFLGIFHASLIGSVAITKKTPRFVGLFISFLLTIILWLVSFFLLHPPTADEPIITVGPFVMLVLNFIVSVLILNFFRENSNIRQ